MLHSNPRLKSLIDKLWNILWSGGISNPLTAIEQITYLLFMKRLDELEAKRVKDAEISGEKYFSRFEGTYMPPGGIMEVPKEQLRWSVFSQLAAEEMLTHIQTNVFPFLKELNGGTSPFTKHMTNAVFIIPKPSLLAEAVKIIDEIFEVIQLDARDGGQTFQDIQGDVYEMLLSEIAIAGKNGQFRTPRHIIKLMADLVKPKIGQRIADPACGTSGFLLGAYQYIIAEEVRRKDPSKLVTDEDGFERSMVSDILGLNMRERISQDLFGFDIDITMVRLGLMNLMMHGIDEPQVDYQDTLSKKYNEEVTYDVVMANPPFTGSIDKSDINESLKLPTTKTELLFLERIFHMLKEDGTAAVIVPHGVLFGSARAFIETRKILVEQCELKAVITMPSGVFKPYAGVSTAILLFSKGGETRYTWFYEMQSDGYSLDDKRNKLDGYGDLHDIVQRFHARDPKKDGDKHAKCFFIPKAEIVDNDYDLSLNKYKEEVYEEKRYEKPRVILKQLEDLEKEILKGLKEIKTFV